MARRQAILAFAVTILVAGCDARPTATTHSLVQAPTPSPAAASSPNPTAAPTPRPSGVTGAFTTRIPQPDGSESIEVTVEDRTGLVEGIEGSIPEVAEDGLAEAPAPAHGLQYTWALRGCSQRPFITFETADTFENGDDAYRLSVVHPDQDGSCLAVEIWRTLMLELRRPIPAARVAVVSGAVASHRLLFDHIVSGRTTEFEMLDRTGLVTGLANTSQLAKEHKLSEAIAPDVGFLYTTGPSFCTYRIVMSFEGTEADRYRMLVWYDTRWESGCAMNDAGRWLLIELRKPISTASVRVVEQPDPEQPEG